VCKTKLWLFCGDREKNKTFLYDKIEKAMTDRLIKVSLSKTHLNVLVSKQRMKSKSAVPT
jgi:hypothetical protein